MQLLNSTGAMCFILNKANIYDEFQQDSSWLLLFIKKRSVRQQKNEERTVVPLTREKEAVFAMKSH